MFRRWHLPMGMSEPVSVVKHLMLASFHLRQVTSFLISILQYMLDWLTAHDGPCILLKQEMSLTSFSIATLYLHVSDEPVDKSLY